MNQGPPASIPALTGLRFIAAACVVASHMLGSVIPPAGSDPVWLAAIRPAAGIGMPLFFVLSGFVIHYNYAVAIQTGKWRGLYNFYAARFARLYPLFFVCLIFDILMRQSFSAGLPESVGSTLPYYLTLTQTWSYQLYNGYYGLNNLVYQYGIMPSVGWSIATEWFFYCAYPFILLILLRFTQLRRLLIAAGLFILAGYAAIYVVSTLQGEMNTWAVSKYGPAADYFTNKQDSFFRWAVYFSPYSRILEFCMGCLTAAIYMQLGKAKAAETNRGRGLLVTAGAVASVLVFYYLSRFASPIAATTLADTFKQSFGMAPPIALLIYACVRYDTLISRALSHPKMVTCGEASYSLYMLHMLVANAFRWESAKVTSNWILVGDSLRFIVAFGAAVGLSLVSWAMIEVPARQWLRRMLLTRAEHSSAKQPGPVDPSVASRPDIEFGSGRER